jgi:hypothetical protein
MNAPGGEVSCYNDSRRVQYTAIECERASTNRSLSYTMQSMRAAGS